MSEFSKVLTTALLSFSVGIISDPIRATIANALSAWKLRRALYIELGVLHRALVRGSGGVAEKNLFVVFVRAVKFETYRYAKTKPDIFYSLREACLIDGMVRIFELAVQDAHLNDDLVCEGCVSFLRSFDAYLKTSALDETLLRKMVPDYFS